MKKLCLLLLAMAMACAVMAQTSPEPNPDLLKLKSGQRVQCRIVSVTPSGYQIEITDEQGEAWPFTYGKQYVSAIDYGYYTSERSAGREASGGANGSFRFRLNGGYSYRLGKLHNDLDVDAFKFRSGFNVGVSPTYVFPNRRYELGVAFDYRVHDYKGEGMIYSSPRVDFRTCFIGPTFILHLPTSRPDPTSNVYFDFSIGYVHYKEKMGDLYFKANTGGMKVSFGQVSRLGDYCALDIRLTLFASSFKEGKSNDYSVPVSFDDPQNISSLNLSLGFVFGKYR